MSKITRKNILISSFILLLFLSSAVFFNMKVTTSQGIDYEVSKIEIPLYLKILNFSGRHFNYKWLVQRVTGDLRTKEEKIFRLFQWTHETIRPQPKNLPVMDDHVWNVYVRGYGVPDNYNDLFSTLCNYIEVDGFFTWVYTKETKEVLPLSFVKLEEGWVVFDPYYGVYFKNKKGGWATVEEIKNENWNMVKPDQTEIPVSFYEPYLKALPDIGEMHLRRANIQSPVNRLKYYLAKWFSGDKSLLE